MNKYALRKKEKEDIIRNGERNLVPCKVCLTDKVRIRAGKYNKDSPRWIDDLGKNWNGKVCPECNNARMRVKMRLARAGEQSGAGSDNNAG